MGCDGGITAGCTVVGGGIGEGSLFSATVTGGGLMTGACTTGVVGRVVDTGVVEVTGVCGAGRVEAGCGNWPMWWPPRPGPFFKGRLSRSFREWIHKQITQFLSSTTNDIIHFEWEMHYRKIFLKITKRKYQLTLCPLPAPFFWGGGISVSWKRTKLSL